MNLSEFYDHVVLRDLLEYTAPGSVVVAGGAGALDIVDFALSQDLRIAHFLTAHPWHALVFLLFSGYLVGHILTAIHGWLFRTPELNLVGDFFKNNSWLAARVSEAIASQLNIQPAEAENLLKNENTPSVIRELGRAVVQLHLPELYREYVNRHSILSRFCENMAIAIAVALLILTVGLGTLMFIRHSPSQMLVDPREWLILMAGSLAPRDWLIIGTGSTIIIGGLASIAALWKRAARLRRTMTRHTFELLYLDHLGVPKTASHDFS